VTTKGLRLVSPTFLLCCALVFVFEPTAGATKGTGHVNWSQYLSKKTGVPCTVQYPFPGETISGVEYNVADRIVETLLSVTSSSQGEDYRLSGTTSLIMTSEGKSSPEPPIEKVQFIQHIYLLKNGSLQIPPQHNTNLQSVQMTGNIDVPSIKDLLGGKTDVSTLTLEQSPSTPAAATFNKKLTTDHSPDIKLRAVVIVSGFLKSQLISPSRTFKNVIGIEEQHSSFVALNLKKGSLESTTIVNELRASIPTSITWYAPGRGTVGVMTTYTTGEPTMSWSSCKG
jgi:hypothetical protein